MENKVLKAAIAKYGKNQWARTSISSLLVRKTPKQCKARWYEWLDPSIKKTEWSKTKDEKLMHLAKIMPTQWRTIASAVGHTATQCLERYQKLLDEAEAKETEELGLAGPGGESALSADDIRRLRPGEIDPDPETKPARPDPIDMDEDEARRLAVLQKKCELKAAGIMCGIDYNADIPFEKKPAAGFYDMSEEQARITSAPVGQSLRPEAKGENDGHQTKFIAAHGAQIQKLKEAESIGQRRKLVLPNAQVGEAELEGIVKIGQTGENAKALVGGGSEATAKLLSDYEGLEGARMARTPHTAPQHDYIIEDNVMLEARNLRNMTMAQTPLLGDENTPLHVGPGGGTGFESATPRHQVAFTPNPLATPMHGSPGDVSATPRDGASWGATPLQTPMHHTLSINPAMGMPVGETPRDLRLHTDSAKRALKAGFMSLPKPENNFELLVPEDEEEEDGTAGPLSEEDAAERNAHLKRIREEEERKALARRTQVVARGLPRPARVDVEQLMRDLNIGEEDDDMAEVRKLLKSEIADLLLHDSIVHPLPGTNIPGGTPSTYQIPPDDDLTAAKAQIHLELASSIGFPDANEAQVKEGLVTLSSSEEIDESACWASVRQQLVFDAASRTWVEPSSLSAEARIASYTALLEENRGEMSKEASKAAKAEKKLGGYQARSKALSKRVTEAFNELVRTKVDYESFGRLSINEAAAGPWRLESLKEEVDTLSRRERLLQERYAELDRERRDAESRVTVLEEKIMAEAEALNEEALAEMEASGLFIERKTP
ncbi:pre-mRNA splicing factor component-domain-containing protein [Suillus fuscotomentosus]|uniref:Pre-mRNA splicing factor component-domain-containing protein n=1 Tax=Suillus fuscotomentosus TaxID=1912939 RepID=A0AAD4HKV3_9AGAM|nr:pre-mRNA splicing factor component-domain-containing protein [Suillus fuscotomentosus]KAG1899891.1 pre-mRNA splicing factor component-domain-containing protein [Suillus fuscotomentosus]